MNGAGWTRAALLGIALVLGCGGSGVGAGETVTAGSPAATRDLAKLSVSLPASAALFPPGEAAEIANGQCLLCHSAGMVLRQPRRTEDQWKAVITKMRQAYGAPLPAEQVDPLAAYLARVVDSQ